MFSIVISHLTTYGCSAHLLPPLQRFPVLRGVQKDPGFSAAVDVFVLGISWVG